MRNRIFLLPFVIALATAGAAEPLPASYSIPIVDVSAEKQRQIVVDREPGQYLGHPTTVLLEDGRTMLCVYPVSYTHLRAHETPEHLVCRLLLEKKKKPARPTC